MSCMPGLLVLARIRAVPRLKEFSGGAMNRQLLLTKVLLAWHYFVNTYQNPTKSMRGISMRYPNCSSYNISIIKAEMELT